MTTPGRLNQVTIAYSRGRVVIPWSSRDALLDEIRHLESAANVRKAFEAVGASRAVVFDTYDKQLLVQAIGVWSGNVTVDGLPEGVWELRNALVDDLHDTAGGP